MKEMADGKKKREKAGTKWQYSFSQLRLDASQHPAPRDAGHSLALVTHTLMLGVESVIVEVNMFA